MTPETTGRRESGPQRPPRAPEIPSSRETCDVLVVGGGPAGSTVAALLAAQGRDVLLVEKAHHPRFHIGESLLPANLPLFEQLGVGDQVARIGMPKYGVEFVSPAHAHEAFIEFADAWDKSMPHAFQVRRADLDLLLFRNAAAKGARTLEGCRVRDVAFDADGADVTAVLDDGAERAFRARYVIDASGRDTFLANKIKSKVKNPKHNSSALFGHFRGAKRLEGKLEGNITIFWFPHGWFWFIPLADGTTSVGAVCWPYYLKSRQKPLKAFFEDTIAMAPRLAERLKDAELVDDHVWATGNYSYSGTQCTGERWLMLGDAFAFIDPVFSSGVMLAMQNAFDCTALVGATLDEPARVPALKRAFEARMRHGPREFSWFIFRVTNPVMRDLFMFPRNDWRVKEALLSLLAGDIFGATPIWGRLRVMKLIYWFSSLQDPVRTVKAWFARRRNIRDLGPLPGENVVEAR